MGCHPSWSWYREPLAIWPLSAFNSKEPTEFDVFSDGPSVGLGAISVFALRKAVAYPAPKRLDFLCRFTSAGVLGDAETR